MGGKSSRSGFCDPERLQKGESMNGAFADEDIQNLYREIQKLTERIERLERERKRVRKKKKAKKNLGS